MGGVNCVSQYYINLWCAALQIAYVPDRHWLTPSWMHDFACTDKYAVLIEQPLYMVRSNTPALLVPGTVRTTQLSASMLQQQQQHTYREATMAADSAGCLLIGRCY